MPPICAICETKFAEGTELVRFGRRDRTAVQDHLQTLAGADQSSQAGGAARSGNDPQTTTARAAAALFEQGDLNRDRQLVHSLYPEMVG